MHVEGIDPTQITCNLSAREGEGWMIPCFRMKQQGCFTSPLCCEYTHQRGSWEGRSHSSADSRAGWLA